MCTDSGRRAIPGPARAFCSLLHAVSSAERQCQHSLYERVVRVVEGDAVSGSNITLSPIFSVIRENNGYYVDKTAFLEPLLGTYKEARLFTRPRRFGKSLSMSMISDFVDISKDSRKLFEDLVISKNQDFCEKWMNQYPVVNLSLVLCEGDTFERAANSLKKAAQSAYRDHLYLRNSDRILPEDKEYFSAVISSDADIDLIQNSVDRLVSMVAYHYEKPVIFIVDEYDRLIEDSAYGKFYEKMKYYLRPMYGSVIKNNKYVKYSFLTGCARMSIESMSSGLNNVECYDVNTSMFSEFMGFTEEEVDRILFDFGLQERKSEVRKWYDGYTFGKTKGIYCPYDVLKFVDDCKSGEHATAQPYWEGTGTLTAVKLFLQKVHPEIDDKIVSLGDGGHVSCRIRKELNFHNISDSQDNIWTLLYNYGYITKADKQYIDENILFPFDDQDIVVVPNKSVKMALLNEIALCMRDGFHDHALGTLTKAFVNVDVEAFQEELNKLLLESVSDFDYHEYFYHAWLLGLLTACGGSVFSNRQSGLGRPDLLVSIQDMVMIVELKRESTSSSVALEYVANRALNQVLDRRYDAPHLHASRVVCWGMGFRGRECRVVARASKTGTAVV